MLSLIPSWAQHLDEFWFTIKKRNIWFIKLRYAAVITLIGFVLFSELVLNFSYSKSQLTAFAIITTIILVYNILLHFYSDKAKRTIEGFNVLDFSLLQMFLDLITLALLIYYTGGIESPLLLLYLFHMIIGSLILPGRVIYSIALFLVLITYLLSAFEYFGIIRHHYLSGFLADPLFDNYKFVLIQALIFGFIIIASVVIANGIARQLYKLEQDLVQSLDNLNKADEEKQRYTMAVVHEIKAPLTAVISFLDIILSKMLGAIPEKVEEKLERAAIRCREAIELINDVLRISKLRLLDEIKKEDIHILEILNNLKQKHQETLDEKNIQLTIVNKQKHHNIIRGDKSYMDLIFSNLISNAIKYTNENGKIKIVIQELKEILVIDVMDNGVGIPQKDLSKIFQDFFRASNIKGKGIEGTGLGLSAVKQLIEKHNGSININSPSEIGDEKNPGTVVTVTFPAYI